MKDLQKEGFAPEVVTVVDLLTKRAGESYESLVNRAAKDEFAREVKLADLADNLEQTKRGPESKEKREKIEQYVRAIETLGGNPSK